MNRDVVVRALGSLSRSPVPALLVMFVIAGGGGGVAFGATFDVLVTSDGLDTLPGDGLCQSVGGQCTLRAAIMETNALPGLDTIRLRYEGPYVLSIPGQGEDASALGDLDITDDLKIFPLVKCKPTPTKPCPKPVVIIDGNHLDRVFHIHPGAKVGIGSVTIRNGDLNDDGGGIRNEGELGLGAVILTDNETFGDGAGIYNDADAVLRLFKSSIRDNIAAGAGGGIYNRDGNVTIVSSTISDNTAATAGGGVKSGGSTGVMTVWNSTISGNSASGQVGGGGIFNGAFSTLTLVNSTVSGNGGPPRGGGIRNDIGLLTLVNSTITNNHAGQYGGGLFNGGGSVTTHIGYVWLVNTIIAGNTAGSANANCSNVPNFGVMTSLGHNLDSDGSCSLTATGDLPSVNPLLGPLQDNGGPTFTQALLNGSPAIDAGDNGFCPSTDQRGAFRPQGGQCDIGAFEVGLLTFLRGKIFEVAVKADSADQFQACVRFHVDGTLRIDTLGSGTWLAPADDGRASEDLYWTGLLSADRATTIRFEGRALIDGELQASGTDDLARSYSLEGIENPACRVR